MDGNLARGSSSFNITPGMVVAVDYETFYDAKQKYSLRNMTPYDYVHDPRFDAYLVALTSEDGQRFVGSPEAFDWLSVTGAHLIAHNMAFDGMVLNRLIETGVVSFDTKACVLDCTADMVAFFCIPRSLKDACHHILGRELSKKVRTAMDGKTLKDLNPAEREEMIAYGGSDADNCLDLWKAKSAEWPEKERKISRENREAGWRGIRINRAGTAAGLQTLLAVKAKAEAALPWVNPLDPKKGEKAGSVSALASHAMRCGLPVPRSFNKQDPGMQAWVAKYAKDYPFIQARLDYAGVNSHIARLEAMLALANHEDVVRSELKYFGAHCLSGDHEVLTRNGWVRLDQWSGGEIMQWRPDRSLEFLPAMPNVFENTDNYMVELDAPYAKALMTPGHTVATHVCYGKRFLPIKAEDLLAKPDERTIVPTNGKYAADGAITRDQMRVLVAAQADGYFDDKRKQLAFGFNKDRKATRLKLILDAVGIPYYEYHYPEKSPRHAFRIKYKNFPVWLTPDRKFFGPWLLDSTAEARMDFLHEVLLWDGCDSKVTHPSGKSSPVQSYNSGIRSNVGWVRTMAHISGLAAGKHVDFVSTSAWSVGNTHSRTTFGPRGLAYVYREKGHVRRADKVDTVYCPTTQTGFFLMRYKDMISVTGNTGRSSSGSETEGGAKLNFLNQSKGDPKTGLTFGVDMRGLLIPRPGYKFCIEDYSNVEPRVTHWLAGNTDFLKLVYKENIYQAAAKVMGWFPMDGDGLKEKDKKTYQLSKSCTIGLGYGMGAAKFLLTCEKMGIELPRVPKDQWVLDRRVKFVLLNHAHLDWRKPEDEEMISKFLGADQIVAKWRQMNPQVQNLWRYFQSQLETAAQNCEPTHAFTLPSGRKKIYYNPHFKMENKIITDPETGAVSTKVEKRLFASTILGYPATALHGGPITENIVQATARDIMFWGAIDIIERRPSYRFLMNCYDEVVFEVPEAETADAEKLIPDCLCRGSASSWTQGLPLEVEGGIRERYEK